MTADDMKKLTAKIVDYANWSSRGAWLQLPSVNVGLPALIRI